MSKLLFLENFLSNQCNSDNNYYERFVEIKKRLTKKYYSDVEMGALWSAIKKGDAPVYLNDHGIDHINQVIQRAGELVKKSNLDLSCFEIYVLLISILIHDAGNIFGREDHEKKCWKILQDLGDLVSEDAILKRAVTGIATTHGGKIENNKDTISKLKKAQPILGETVKSQLLAALLRFADELADDRSRASRFMLDEELLDQSEVFHKYSYVLHTVEITKKEIILHFVLDVEDVTRKFKKLDDEVFLIDEIYERTWKMHLERVYCSRFFGTQVDIDRIRVSIEIWKNFDKSPDIQPVEEIGYALEIKGYPQLDQNNMFQICPKIKGKSGKELQKEFQKITDQ